MKIFQKYNPNEKKQTLQREDPRTQANGQEKTKEHFRTIVPKTNDKNTQYPTGTRSKPDKRNGTDMSLEERLKTLAVGENHTKGSRAETLKQALHNHDAK